MSRFLLTKTTHYKAGDAGPEVLIPDVEYLFWFLYKVVVSTDSDHSPVPPRTDDTRAYGGIILHDIDAIDDLIKLTPRLMIPGSDPLAPRLIVRYEVPGGTTRKRTFKPVLFGAYPGASMWTLVKPRGGQPQVQVVTFRVMIPIGGSIADHVFEEYA